MSRLALLGIAALLSAAAVAPAAAQEVISNPGYCAQFYPNANCQNKGPNNPYTGDYQRRLQLRDAYVAGAGPGAAELLLARAVTDEQRSRIGNQTGGRVFLFLETDDIARDYERLQSKGVVFISPMRQESYGAVAVFTDLYGNKIDLVEHRGPR